MTATAWQDRPALQALSPERLGALVDGEVERSERMLFTLTPRDQLDAIGRCQQLADQAFAQQVRMIVQAHTWSAKQGREFAADELALVLGVGPGSARNVLHEALGLASLVGMVEAIEAGWLTQRHARSVLRTLDEVELTLEQRDAISTIVLARMRNETPYQLELMTKRLILTVDPTAARARQDSAGRRRNIKTWGGADGQGVVHGTGPLQDIAAIRESLGQWLREHPKAADDDRCESEREWDLFVQLLTGGTSPGQWQAQIVVPFTTAAGGELELAQIPGLGPVLPSTAQDLLDVAEWAQVAVDELGQVIALQEAVVKPARPCPLGGERAEALRLISQAPPERVRAECLGTDAYVTPTRLRTVLEARDRHCVFPGCGRRITDVDHRIPWPLGPTAASNCQLLCRHHHRAKQAVFSVELNADGDHLWTHHSGWQFLRHRRGY